MSKSHLEEEFARDWEIRFPEIDLYEEHTFYPERRFRFDFANLESKVAIEIQGGIWSREESGHKSGSGIQRDCTKQCLAASLGWLVFPLSEAMMRDEQWLNLIAQTIEDRKHVDSSQSPNPLQPRYQSFGGL